MKRVTRKQQYINSLEHDIQWADEVIRSGKHLDWRYGEPFTRRQWILLKDENVCELNKVQSDLTYKPWIELPELY